MGENQKVQILTADMMRRLANTADELEDEVYTNIVDKYAQKIINSGYGTNKEDNCGRNKRMESKDGEM